MGSDTAPGYHEEVNIVRVKAFSWHFWCSKDRPDQTIVESLRKVKMEIRRNTELEREGGGTVGAV